MSKVPYAGQEDTACRYGRKPGNARGHKDNGRGFVTIAVRFSPAAFDRINAEARRRGEPFAAVVRDLVDRGIVAAELPAAAVPRSELAIGDLFEPAGGHVCCNFPGCGETFSNGDMVEAGWHVESHGDPVRVWCPKHRLPPDWRGFSRVLG